MTTTLYPVAQRQAVAGEPARGTGGASVFIVGPANLSREGLDRILTERGFSVVGQGSKISEFLGHVTEQPAPELLLIDVGDGKTEIFDLVTRAREAASSARIVVLAETVAASDLGQAFAAGADGYLLTSISSHALLESLRLVLLGEKVFPTCLASLIFKPGHAAETVNGDGMLDLSSRERQILTCLTAGFSNKIIADRLQIAEATVKVHLKTVCRKIKVSNRTQAAIWAVNRGLAMVGEDAGRGRGRRTA